MLSDSLWGDFFDVEASKEKTKEIIKKAKTPKKAEPMDADKAVASKRLSVKEKIVIVQENVFRVLAKQVDNVSVIGDREAFHDYIDKAIAHGTLAVDTETNNSLDPLTCKLMGLCLYYPGAKQAYIPVNHVDPDTRERLPWQLTEKDIREEVQRVVDAKTYILMHNAKFDFQVLKCTCGVEIMADWDTEIAAKLIDENEGATLKEQYVLHVDPEQKKYKINQLFDKMEYAVFPPSVFALYAATDSMMTYRLYEYQRPIMESDGFKRIRELFEKIEMPCVAVVADMELTGVTLDLEYDKRLSVKYHKLLDDVNVRASAELERLKPQLDAWRLTPEANFREKLYPSAKECPDEESALRRGYGLRDDGGKLYKLAKSKAQQLADPPNLESDVQVSILLYDVLGAPTVNPKKPRAVGDDELEAIIAKTHLPICFIIQELREVTKLINTYIDKLPKTMNERDGRVHGHFNQYGAATGRLSSSNPNLQNIPSHNKEVRMLFKASSPLKDVKCVGNVYIVSKYDDIFINNGWISAENVSVGDKLQTSDGKTDIVASIRAEDNQLYISVK